MLSCHTWARVPLCAPTGNSQRAGHPALVGPGSLCHGPEHGGGWGRRASPGTRNTRGAPTAPSHQQGCGTGLPRGLPWLQEQGLHPPWCVEWCSFQTPAPQAGQRAPLPSAVGLEAPVTGWGQKPLPHALSTQFSIFHRRGRVAGRRRLSGEPGQGQVGLLGPFMIGGDLEYTPGVCPSRILSPALDGVCLGPWARVHCAPRTHVSLVKDVPENRQNSSFPVPSSFCCPPSASGPRDPLSFQPLCSPRLGTGVWEARWGQWPMGREPLGHVGPCCSRSELGPGVFSAGLKAPGGHGVSGFSRDTPTSSAALGTRWMCSSPSPSLLASWHGGDGANSPAGTSVPSKPGQLRALAVQRPLPSLCFDE